MSAKIHVDNIAAATTENDLKEIFSAYGNVAEINFVVERTQSSRVLTVSV